MRFLAILLLCVSFNSIAQPKIEFIETTLDLGTVREGETYKFAWCFKNTGNRPLHIEKIKSSGSILAGEPESKIVEPGQGSRIFGVLSTTGWHDQPFRKTLLVETNAGANILITAKGFISDTGLRVGRETLLISNYNCDMPKVVAPKQYDDKIYNIQPGDVLFQDLDCGAACDAIEKVTEGVNSMDFSHCGIVVQMGNDMMVVEAYGAVKATPVNDFLARTKDASGHPKVVIGRLKDQQSSLADESAEIAKEYVGKGYDDAFEMGNDKYYCSELVYECFRKANKNKPFFQLNRMTFKEPGTTTIMPFWVDYFKKLDKPVPEGKNGINPGAMSRNADIQIISLQQL